MRRNERTGGAIRRSQVALTLRDPMSRKTLVEDYSEQRRSKSGKAISAQNLASGTLVRRGSLGRKKR